jgi:hypothetical protein
LKAARNKCQVKTKKQQQNTTKPIRITADFSTKRVKARRAWNDVF